MTTRLNVGFTINNMGYFWFCILAFYFKFAAPIALAVPLSFVILYCESFHLRRLRSNPQNGVNERYKYGRTVKQNALLY